MKVAFINPKGTIFSKNPQLASFLEQSTTMGSFRHFWSAPCLGLLAIAAYCPPDWELTYWDENQRPLPFADYDLVCISAMTVQAERAYAIADAYRERGALVLLGGIHATVLPDEALLHADVVIAGEGEALFPQFIRDYQENRVKRFYREDEPGGFDMSRCVTPRYALLEGYAYPVINLYTTRGCPRSCSFCCASNVYGIRYRRKTNPQILSEIAEIGRLFPDKLLLFADDNLFVNRSASKELLRCMRPLGVRWIAQTDVTVAEDEELLRLMAEAGCQWIVIGFESVSPGSLETLEKQPFKARHRQRYASHIDRIQSFGIGVYGTFIVGLDGDGPDIFRETAAFIVSNHLYGANITVPTPLPGTEIREKLLRAGRVMDKGWSWYTLWDVVARPGSMTAEQLEAGVYELYRAISTGENAADRLRAILRRERTLRRGEESCRADG